MGSDREGMGSFMVRGQRLGLLILIGGLSVPALGTGDLSLAVSAGARFEDNLVVEELDRADSESDIASVAQADLGYQWDITEADRFKTGYKFEQRSFAERSEFDLQLHYGFVDYSHELGGLRLGTNLDATLAKLDGDRLLDNRQASLYASGLARPKLFVRGAVSFQETDFARASDRASESGRFSSAAYYFLDGADEYVNLSYRFEREDARAGEFDFDAHRVSLGYTKRFHLSERRSVRLRADWRFENRDYDNVTPSIGEQRDEDRQRWRLRLDAPITKALSLELKYEHRDYSSNLDALDFTDNRVQALVSLQLF